MKDQIFTAIDPASPDGDKSATVRYKMTDDEFEIMEVLYGKPLAKYQKDLLKVVKKLGKKAILFQRPRCLGKKSTVLEALRSGKLKAHKPPQFFFDEPTDVEVE